MNPAIQSSLVNIANQVALPTAQEIIGTSKNRIQRLREKLFVDAYPVCIEKIRLLTESYKQTEGKPMIIRFP